MSSTYAHFFDMMGDFGFFEHIYEHLPDDFTAMFEIARVLEDESHLLTRQLSPALQLVSSAAVAGPSRPMPDPEVFLPTGEEYESHLMRNLQDIPRIYTYQFLLPDEIFYRKVAERTLWVPFAKEPTYRRIQSESDDYNPDSRKQKVYILLDTSSSMGVKNRINLAKAVVYYFLKHNLTELGHISLRTFDTELGDLHVAKDPDSFHALISYVMRLHTLGKGTAMAKAITRAISDIRELPQSAGTEILIITDGACTLDEQEIRRRMADAIRINTVKIGKAQMFASRKMIEDTLVKDDTPARRALNILRRTEANLLHELTHTTSPTARHKLEASLKYVQGDISRKFEELAAEYNESYGHEIERLSTVYVQVDDVSTAAVFHIDEERYDELEELLLQIEKELQEEFSIESLKKLALLNDHIALLANLIKEREMLKKLNELERRADALLKASVEQRLTSVDSSFAEHFTFEDRHDVQFLLEHGMHVRIPLWKLILLKVFARLQRFMRRRRYLTRLS